MIFIKGESLSSGIYPRCKIQYVIAKTRKHSSGSLFFLNFLTNNNLFSYPRY